MSATTFNDFANTGLNGLMSRSGCGVSRPWRSRLLIDNVGATEQRRTIAELIAFAWDAEYIRVAFGDGCLLVEFVDWQADEPDRLAAYMGKPVRVVSDVPCTTWHVVHRNTPEND